MKPDGWWWNMLMGPARWTCSMEFARSNLLGEICSMLDEICSMRFARGNPLDRICLMWSARWDLPDETCWMIYLLDETWLMKSAWCNPPLLNGSIGTLESARQNVLDETCSIKLARWNMLDEICSMKSAGKNLLSGICSIESAWRNLFDRICLRGSPPARW